MEDILPSVISQIDGRNLQLLDKIFQLLSISFKYLVKPIREHIHEVYSVYFLLLSHKNPFVRKFTAQSFSYIVRKLTFGQHLVQMLFAPLTDSDDQVNGLSELLLEVIAGQGEDLHSKARTMLQELLAFPGILSEQGETTRKVIRYLYLKLVNTVDTAKQMPLYEELTSALVKVLGDTDDKRKQRGLCLLFQVINDSVRLKFGKRVSPEAVILCI
jgi:hypothetical protein